MGDRPSSDVGGLLRRSARDETSRQQTAGQDRDETGPSSHGSPVKRVTPATTRSPVSPARREPAIASYSVNHTVFDRDRDALVGFHHVGEPVDVTEVGKDEPPQTDDRHGDDPTDGDRRTDAEEARRHP